MMRSIALALARRMNDAYGASGAGSSWRGCTGAASVADASGPPHLRQNHSSAVVAAGARPENRGPPKEDGMLDRGVGSPATALKVGVCPTLEGRTEGGNTPPDACASGAGEDGDKGGGI